MKASLSDVLTARMCRHGFPLMQAVQSLRVRSYSLNKLRERCITQSGPERYAKWSDGDVLFVEVNSDEADGLAEMGVSIFSVLGGDGSRYRAIISTDTLPSDSEYDAGEYVAFPEIML